jgi:hypothetical protein
MINVRRVTGSLMAVIFAGGCLVAALATAGARPHPQPPPVVRVSVARDGIHGPSVIRPGVTTFKASSSAGGTQSLQVARLKSGTTHDQIQGYMRSGDLKAVFSHVAAQGGIAHSGYVVGDSWTTRLVPGRYLYVDDEAGMAAPFAVRGAAQSAAVPSARGTVVLKSGGFALPKDFGNGAWRFVNQDGVAHELAFIRIDGRHTKAQALAAVKHDKHDGWLPPVGTLNALTQGQEAWHELSGLHGDFLLVDYVAVLQGAATGPVAQFHHFG